MVEMIFRNQMGEWVVQTESQKHCVLSLKALFEKRLVPQGTTLAGRLKSTSSLLKRTRHIPLWIDSKAYFMVIPNHQSPERIYINGTSVKNIKLDKKGSILTFTSGHTYNVQFPYCNLKARLNRLQKDIQMIQEICEAMDSKVPW